LGYVGLPLAMRFAQSGFEVVGLDNDVKKINKISTGVSLVEDVKNYELVELLQSGSLTVTTHEETVGEADVIVLCLPTPLDGGRNPDLSYIKLCITSIARYIHKGALIIVESTISPGTMRNILIPLFEKESGNQIADYYFAFSPERVDPLNSKWNLKNTPKIVAGLTEISRKKAIDLYAEIIDTVIECESLEVAETAKLLENSFRLVNISFVNELAIFCQKLGIDIKAVIAAAATKPYGFMPFYPGIGVGGHCIPVDPLYLSSKARELGVSSRLIDLSDQINQEMPGYFVGRAEEKLLGLMGKKVLVVGVAYKPNVADARETPVSALIKGLRAKGAQVSWHDDLIKEWNDEKSADLKAGFDLAVIATLHSYMDLTKLSDTPILDTRGSI
jgi:UDP-N-acetyl-D-glucosamine dehydrogenase